MNNLRKLIFSFVAIYIASTTFVLADHGASAATVFKVIMRKVELCTGSTPNSANMADAASCLNPVVIGSGDKEVDVAAVGAGSVAASYGDPALFPLGETYTHMRVTLDRKMTLKGSPTTGDGHTCRTQAVGSGANFPGGSLSGNEKYSHRPVVAEGNQTLGEMDIYNINDQYSLCDQAACTSTDDDQGQTYGQGTGSSIGQSQHADGSTSDDHIMVYELSTPYTVGLVSPTMDIAFGTSTAVQAHDTAVGLCQIDASDPVVTITIK